MSDRADLVVEIIEPDAAAISPGSFDRSRAVDVLVIGPCLAEPLGKADRLRQLAPRAQVVFLLATGNIERFRTSLPFVPHLSDAWTASVDAPTDAVQASDRCGTNGNDVRSHQCTTGVRARDCRSTAPPAADHVVGEVSGCDLE